MENHNVADSHNGILVSQKKECSSDLRYNVDEP